MYNGIKIEWQFKSPRPFKLFEYLESFKSKTQTNVRNVNIICCFLKPQIKKSPLIMIKGKVWFKIWFQNLIWKIITAWGLKHLILLLIFNVPSAIEIQLFRRGDIMIGWLRERVARSPTKPDHNMFVTDKYRIFRFICMKSI